MMHIESFFQTTLSVIIGNVNQTAFNSETAETMLRRVIDWLSTYHAVKAIVASRGSRNETTHIAYI